MRFFSSFVEKLFIKCRQIHMRARVILDLTLALGFRMFKNYQMVSKVFVDLLLRDNQKFTGNQKIHYHIRYKTKLTQKYIYSQNEAERELRAASWQFTYLFIHATFGLQACHLVQFILLIKLI